MKRNYELVVIFEPEIKAEEKEELLKKIKKIISKEDKIKEEKEWGRKELAYPIRKQRVGIFYWFSFSADPSLPLSLKKILSLEEKILRYLLVVKE